MEDYVFCTRRLEGSAKKKPLDSFRVVFYLKKKKKGKRKEREDESTEVVTIPNPRHSDFCCFGFSSSFNSACARTLLWWRKDVVVTPCVECLPFLVPTWEGLRKFYGKVLKLLHLIKAGGYKVFIMPPVKGITFLWLIIWPLVLFRCCFFNFVFSFFFFKTGLLLFFWPNRV